MAVLTEVLPVATIQLGEVAIGVFAWFLAGVFTLMSGRDAPSRAFPRIQQWATHGSNALGIALMFFAVGALILIVGLADVQLP
jgi:hypothetical protein